MLKNLDKYKTDFDRLLAQGNLLIIAMQHECYPEKMEQSLEKSLGKKAESFISELPSFGDEYQSWYSEAKVLIKQLLPDRLADFIRHYEKPRPRKDISHESYRIEDYLQGLNITRGWEKVKVVGPEAAIPQLRQQISILKSLERRFDSTLFDIEQLVQADLFDSELAAAQELLKNGYTRAAGAVAGVVLERHLSQVCKNHGIGFRKKNLTISDFNDAVKKGGVVDTPAWRSIQYLGDIRNLCDHGKTKDPTKAQVQDLIDGAGKLSKTLF